MRAILIAALLVSVMALSGCVASASGLSQESAAERQAAKTFKEDADLAGDAVLVGVVGAEWTNESLVSEIGEQSPDAAALAEQGVDEQPGDGRANAWAYFYQSEEGDNAAVVVIDAGGEVLDRKLIGDVDGGSQVFGLSAPIDMDKVNVDSDEAAAIVNDNHARFSNVSAEEDAMVMMILAQDDEYFEAPFWAFMAFTVEGEDFVFALVNADDGSYQDFSGFFGG